MGESVGEGSGEPVVLADAPTNEHDVAIAQAAAEAAVEIAEVQAEAAVEQTEAVAEAASSQENDEWDALSARVTSLEATNASLLSEMQELRTRLSSKADGTSETTEPPSRSEPAEEKPEKPERELHAEPEPPARAKHRLL